MGGFIVERYWPGVTDVDVRTVGVALRRHASGSVAYLGCVLMTVDEVALFRFDAPDAADVEACGTAAGLRCDRIVPAAFID